VRPLDALGSLKAKLSVVILAAVGTTALVGVVGVFYLGLTPETCALLAAALALGVVQLLARGLTAPLRAMAAAATAMARGEHGHRVTVSGRDEVAQLATAFNRMAAELEETDRVRRDLVANASHELRTPITALRAKLENVVDGVEPADAEVLGGLLAQTERLQLLVAQLLDLSRLESESFGLQCAEVRVADLVAAAVADVRLTAPGVRFDVDVLPPGLRVEADGVRLAQVLGNLLDNATRHGPADGRVRVAAAAHGSGVRLEIVDEGPGIPAAKRERVFERFHRADAARARVAPGTAEAPPGGGGGAGLGLAIVRGIVELHGGTVRAEEAAPHGCRMVVELPGPGA